MTMYWIYDIPNWALGILTVAVFMALVQLKIATQIVVGMFYIVLGGIVLAAALAFGLGGRNAAQRLLDGAYEKGQAAMPQAREEMALAKERAAERAQEVRRSIDEPPGGEPGAGPPPPPVEPGGPPPRPATG